MVGVILLVLTVSVGEIDFASVLGGRGKIGYRSLKFYVVVLHLVHFCLSFVYYVVWYGYFRFLGGR